MKTRNQTKRWFVQPIVVTAAMALLAGNCVAAPAVLINRYSFESERSLIAYDSIGGQHGTVQPGALQTGGSVIMDGSSNSYVELPPGLISSATISQDAVTLEAWADFEDLPYAWVRLFDFGDSDGITGGYYLFFTPHGGGHTVRLMASSGHIGGGGLYEDGIILPGTLANFANAHIVCVADFGSDKAAIYLNGVLLGEDTDFTKDLTDIHDVFSYLGKSLYPYDPNLVGSIHEFRIYDGALEPEEVMASYEAGPDPASIPADLKIVPETLNLNSQGEWITAILGLPEGFNVADVDPESIRLNGETPAAFWSADETEQLLVVGFPREAVTWNFPPSDEVPLTVTGMVGGVAEFAGTDIISVTDQGNPRTYVPLPLPELTDDIRGDGWTSGWLYRVFYPSGDLLLGGVPFHFEEDEAGNTIFFGGTLGAPEEDTLVIPVGPPDVGLRGVKTVYTLINSAYGAAGATNGSLTFVGSKGDTYTVDLIEGLNVRDHWYNVNDQGDDVFVNTTTDPFTIEAVFGVNEPLNAHFDMQAFTLPGKFAGQNLTEIRFDSFLLDPYNAGKPFIAAATAEVVGKAP